VTYDKIAHNQGALTVREKMVKRGVTTLTDTELLQTIAGIGTNSFDAKQIARDISVVEKKHGVDNITIDDLITIKGIGVAKATLIFASLEFWRRRFIRNYKPIIDSPDEAAKQFDDMKNRKQETVAIITLDGARRLINRHIISVGTLTSSLVHPREVFYPAIEDRAASIIIAHNHPSGMLTASEQDREITKRIKDTGELLGIPLDDHLIITVNGYVSAG